MLNLDNIDLMRVYLTDRELAEYIRNYMYQFYVECNYRLAELDKRIKELEKNEKS